MSPRQVRQALDSGSMRLETKNPPPPPPEWTPRRREKMQRDIRAAYLFVVKRKKLEQIARKLNPDVGKARIQQYVERGCRFFLDRKWVRKA